jgi:3',5'-cyclic AMP phosphodiesterase CpdA
MRIIVTSDLHVESTGLEPIRRLVAGITRENPDLVVLAGDLGNPARLFEQCLNCFLRVDVPVAVLPGNHDVWSSHGETSALLYNELLPEVTRTLGFHWLEGAPLITDAGVGLCGSLGWYDYSARESALGQSDEEVLAVKPRYALDAVKVDWEYTDQEFAALCRAQMGRQIEALEQDPRVATIVAVTHVPVFENQIERRPEDLHWSRGNAYFGHLTMGALLERSTKVSHVISGHTHVGMNGLVERTNAAPIATAVVASDYGRPRWLTIDI